MKRISGETDPFPLLKSEYEIVILTN